MILFRVEVALDQD